MDDPRKLSGDIKRAGRGNVNRRGAASACLAFDANRRPRHDVAAWSPGGRAKGASGRARVFHGKENDHFSWAYEMRAIKWPREGRARQIEGSRRG